MTTSNVQNIEKEIRTNKKKEETGTSLGIFSIDMCILSKIGNWSFDNFVGKWVMIYEYTHERFRMNSRQADATVREHLFDWKH